MGKLAKIWYDIRKKISVSAGGMCMGIERSELVSRLREQTAQLRAGVDEPQAIDQRAIFGALQSIREAAESDELDIHPLDPFARRIDAVAESYQDQLIYMARIDGGNFAQEALDLQMDRYPFRTARRLGKLALDSDHVWQTGIVVTGETTIGRPNPLLYMARIKRAESQAKHLAPYVQQVQGTASYQKPENPAHVHSRELRSASLAKEAFRRLVKNRPGTAL